MKVRVTKIAGGESMRTAELVGVLERSRFPRVGECVVVLGDPLGEGDLRVFSTSTVCFISGSENSRTVTTISGSVYELQEISDEATN